MDNLSKKRASTQIPTEQHSYFRWQQAKIGNYVWYDSDSIAHQSLKSNWSQRKCYVWMPRSDLSWQDKLWFSSWRFVEQSALVNNHLVCYWPTIQNSVLKICPEFQVLSSHLLEVDELIELLIEHWAKIVGSEIISTPIYMECDKMHRSNVCIQEFQYIVSGQDLTGLDIQSEQS